MSNGILTWPFQWLACLLLSDKWAPEDHIAGLSPISLLVIHGLKDQVIDYDLGQEVFERAKEPKEMWTIPEGRHIDSFWRHDHRYRARFLQWLDKVEKETTP